MNRLYAVLPWGVIALGVTHMAASFKIYSSLSSSALWFFDGGIMLVFGAILNLINRRYGVTATGLRWFCRAANVVTLVFATVSGFVGGASVGSLVIVLGLLGAITILSFLHGSLAVTPG